MASALKKKLFHAAKRLGLFRAARWATRNDLRILCYHGTSLAGESAFRPGLFIEPESFAQRLRALKEKP